MGKPKALETTASLPRDWLPMFEWPRWHYEKQREFTRSFAENFETMFKAGNGAGKTACLYWNLVTAAMGVHPYQKDAVKATNVKVGRPLPDPPLNIKVLVNDFEHGLDKVAFETLCVGTNMPDGSFIERLLPASQVKSMPSKEDKSYRLANGSVFFFMTSEQKRQLHSGTNFDILACDEEPKKYAYDESKRGLRNAKGGGRIVHSFTPPLPDDPSSGPTWTRYDLYEPWLERKIGKPDIHIIEARMRDNPAITEEFIRRFSIGKTDSQLRVQLDGDYPQWGKLVHPDFEDYLWDVKECRGHLLPHDMDLPWDREDMIVEFALDWHSSKPAAALWMYEDKEGNVIVFDELSPESVRDKTISQLCEIIRVTEGHPWTKPKVRRFGDPKMKDRNNALVSGFCAWDEFRNNGIFMAEAYNKQPEVGISVVNDYFRGNTKTHPRLFIRETCENLRRALRNHYWVQSKDGSGEPDKKWSDYPVCLKYVVQRKARSVKKGMYRKRDRWGITSYDGLPGYGPYSGLRVVGG